MKYKVFYIPNKNRLDSSYLDKTRTMLMTSPYSVSQIPLFTEVPFIVPKFKLGIMKQQPQTYTLSDKHEIFVDLDDLNLIIDNHVQETKLALKKDNRNKDYEKESLVALDDDSITRLSHKQQLDLLNQLLLFKQEVQNRLHPPEEPSKTVSRYSIKSACSPSLLGKTTQPPKPKEVQVPSAPRKEHRSGEKKHGKHRHHHSAKIPRRIYEKLEMLQNQLFYLQGQRAQQPAGPPEVRQRELPSTEPLGNRLLQEIEQRLGQIAAQDDRLSEQWPGHGGGIQVRADSAVQKNAEPVEESDTRQCNRKAAGSSELFKGAQPDEARIRYRTYLPKFSRGVTDDYRRQIKAYYDFATGYQSVMFSPALVRCRLSKERVFQLVADEITQQLFYEAVQEFANFVYDIMAAEK